MLLVLQTWGQCYKQFVSCNWVFLKWSNWQKVQLNIDLLKLRHKYIYRRMMAWLKLNEIRSIIKMGDFNKRSHFERGGPGSLQWDVFTMDKGSWKFLWKFNEITKFVAVTYGCSTIKHSCCCVHAYMQVSISPTFYEHLLRPNRFGD